MDAFIPTLWQHISSYHMHAAPAQRVRAGYIQHMYHINSIYMHLVTCSSLAPCSCCSCLPNVYSMIAAP